MHTYIIKIELDLYSHNYDDSVQYSHVENISVNVLLLTAPLYHLGVEGTT